MVAAADNGVAF